MLEGAKKEPLFLLVSFAYELLIIGPRNFILLILRKVGPGTPCRIMKTSLAEENESFFVLRTFTEIDETFYSFPFSTLFFTLESTSHRNSEKALCLLFFSFSPSTTCSPCLTTSGDYDDVLEEARWLPSPLFLHPATTPKLFPPKRPLLIQKRQRSWEQSRK